MWWWVHPLLSWCWAGRVLKCCIAPSPWPWLSLDECCNPWPGSRLPRQLHSSSVQCGRPSFAVEPDLHCSLQCRGKEETALQDALPARGLGLAWSWADGAGAVAVPGLGEPAPRAAVSSLLWELQGLFTLYTLYSCSASSHLVLSLLL